MFKAKAILNLIAIFSVAVTAITLGSVAADGPTDAPTNQPETKVEVNTVFPSLASPAAMPIIFCSEIPTSKNFSG